MPANSDVPLANLCCPDLAVEAARRGVVESVSASTVPRWLDADALKPWRHRSWISPRDPQFVVKAARVLDLYARIWDGELRMTGFSSLRELERRGPPPG